MGLTDYSHMDKEFYPCVMAEQERIIKLLGSQIYHDCPECLDRAVNDEIVALIKEEK